MALWWECKSSFVRQWRAGVPAAAKKRSAMPAAAPAPGVGVVHRATRPRHHHYWASPGRRAGWVAGTLVTCGLVGAGGVVAAGGYPGGYWPGAGGGFLAPIPGAEANLEVPVGELPEPSSILVLAVGAAVTIALRRKR